MRKQPRFLCGSALAVGAVATTMLLAGNARADVFDTTLASPNTIAANNTNNPSWYNGSGNPQGGWTVNTDATSGVEVGLRAKYRNVNAVIDTPNDDYVVTPGGCVIPSCSATPHPTWALWNYEFSIDLRPNGANSANPGITLADIDTLTTLTVTARDANNNIVGTGSVNPLTHWVDDTGFGSGAGGAGGLTSTGKHIPEAAGDWGVQNSENLGFGDSPLAGFNPNAAYTYEFVLTVVKDDGTVLGSTDMEVHATPEPTGILLLGTAALGVVLKMRRRKVTA